MPDYIPPPEPGAALGPTALEALRPELALLDPRTLLTVNVDMAAAALVVLGAASEIQSHRPALVALVGEEMAACVDRLQLLAHAALEAHAKYRLIETGADVLPLSTQLVEIRDALIAEVRALIARKVLPPGVIGEVKGGHGYKNQCVDVLQLVSLLKESWATVHLKTGVAMADLDRAESLAHRLAAAVGTREQGTRSPAADLRLRAYTLLFATYDDARRLITFLRWKDGDYERIAPSLYGGRSNGRKRSSAEPTAPAAEPVVPAAPIAPGMPGASPFISG